MDMTGETLIPAPREAVWRALNDAEILRQSIPGCETIDKTSDTSFTAKVVAKVGPVRATFTGEVQLTDLDPPNGYRISGEGKGGPAGFAKGGATVKLTDAEGGTMLHYKVDAQIGGKLAQIGSRLIDATARKMAEEFFGKFSELVTAQAAAEATTEIAPGVEAPVAETSTAAAPAAVPAGGASLSPAIWILGLLVVVGAVLWYFTR